MNRSGEGLEFDAEIGRDGILRVPGDVLKRLSAGDPARVRVRLVSAALAEELVRRQVTEGEVERIASLQMESRSQVISFLLSEGALSHGTPGRSRKNKRRAR